MLFALFFVAAVADQRKNSFPLFLSLRCGSILQTICYGGLVLRVACWCCSLCDSIAQVTDVVVCFGAVVCDFLSCVVALVCSCGLRFASVVWLLVVSFLWFEPAQRKTILFFLFLAVVRRLAFCFLSK